MRVPSVRPAILLALAAPMLLAGCGGGGRGAGALANIQAPCPRVGILAEAADMTRFAPGAVPDVGTVEVNARITGYQAKCDYAPGGRGLDVNLSVQVVAERGPAARGRDIELPYVVAVVAPGEERVLSRGTDSVRVSFASNVSRGQAVSPDLLIRIPGEPRDAAANSILIGFQLTSSQLELNRARGPR